MERAWREDQTLGCIRAGVGEREARGIVKQ